MYLNDNAVTHSYDTPNGGEKETDRPDVGAVNISESQMIFLDYEVNDSDNPRQWPFAKRVLVSLAPIIGAITICLSTPIYIASIPGVIELTGVDETLALSGISLWALGLSLGPAITASVSELRGRQIVFRLSLPLCLAFTIVGRCANNFRTIAVARFVAGVAGAPCVTVTVGVLNDVWDVEKERAGTLLVALFAACMIWATEVAPAVGEAVVRGRDWRWTFWLIAILLGVSILAAFLIPETFKPTVLKRRAKKLGLAVPRRKSIISLVTIACGRPLHMLAIEPLVWPTSLVLGILQAVVYVLYVAYFVIFQRIYSFTNYQVGLAFLPLFVGSVIGLGIVSYFDKKKYQVEKAEAASEGRPIASESRLYPALVGSVLWPISLFWLAWTSRPSIHWTVPLMSGLPFGCGYLVSMLALPVHQNDVYGPEFGASALAADNIVRYLFSAASPLFTVQMIDKLGIGWAMSLCGFLALALLPVPWIMFRWGPSLRARSRYVKIAAATV